MRAQLATMKLVPRGEDGWGTPELTFGNRVTLVAGPNGVGKTPVIKALELALGYPVELHPMVTERCSSVEVTFADHEQTWILRRELTGVSAVVEGSDGASVNLSDERAIAEWVLPKLGLEPRTLLTYRGTLTTGYMSVVGPAFLLDQDTGWANLYVPWNDRVFIKDQREEVVRWLLALPPRNAAVDKTVFQKAKAELQRLSEELEAKRVALEQLAAELGEDSAPDASQRLVARQETVSARLREAESALAARSRSENLVDLAMADAMHRRDAARFELENAERRRKAVAEARMDVESEVKALEQNEVAAEVFRTLCGNENCRFFRQPEESYGRRVLFLKDQLKDFRAGRNAQK